MSFANDILDAIEIMVKQVVEDNATKIYTGVCKTIGTGNCVLTINGKDNTVKYYGGVPVVGTVYQVFIPFGNMSAAFIIVPGSDGGSGGSGVDSVNGMTGDVVLNAADVGLGNVDNIKQYSASNPPPYPVVSVNGKTGGVNLIASDVGAAPSTYLGNISRNKIYKIGCFFKGSGASSSGAVTIRIRNFSDYGTENYMLAFLGTQGFSVEYHGQVKTSYLSKISVYSDPSVTGSTKKYTVFVTTQNYVDWAGVYIDNEHSFTRDFADVTDTFSALVDGLDKVWESEYEYLNPPMQLGVEYRTTERYMGKPVYVKLVDFGALPNTASKYVNPNISNFEKLIEPMTVTIAGSDSSVHDSPLLADTKIVARSWFKMTSGGIAIRTMEDCTSNSAVVKLKYTKTTD